MIKGILLYTVLTDYSIQCTHACTQADALQQKTGETRSKKYRCFKYSSIVLNLVTIALGISLAVLFTMTYSYLYRYPKERATKTFTMTLGVY